MVILALLAPVGLGILQVARNAADIPVSIAVIEGAVRDSAFGTPIPGVVVALDGMPRDTTGRDGAYRIDGVAVGNHMLRFFQPEFLAVLDGVTFDVAIAIDEVLYQLDVPWPSTDRLVKERCAHSIGWRYGPVALLGRVQTSGTRRPMIFVPKSVGLVRRGLRLGRTTPSRSTGSVW